MVVRQQKIREVVPLTEQFDMRTEVEFADQRFEFRSFGPRADNRARKVRSRPVRERMEATRVDGFRRRHDQHDRFATLVGHVENLPHVYGTVASKSSTSFNSVSWVIVRST